MLLISINTKLLLTICDGYMVIGDCIVIGGIYSLVYEFYGEILCKLISGILSKKDNVTLFYLNFCWQQLGYSLDSLHKNNFQVLLECKKKE